MRFPTRGGAEISLERDDSNVFEDSPSAIAVRASVQAKVSDGDFNAPPAFVKLAGVIDLDIDLIYTLDEARELHRALGKLIEGPSRVMKSSIGDVLVHVGEPPASNPYRGEDLSGDERAAALRAFRDGGDTSRWTYWHAPGSGGARRISDPSQIDWRGMRS